MAERTLYVTDLDGTLLGEGAAISEFTVRTLDQLIDEGALITCATARSWVTAQRVLGSLRFRLPMVLSNGTFTLDAINRIVLDQHVLAESVAEVIIELCQAGRIPPVVYQMVGPREQAAWLPHEINDGMARYWADRPSDPRASPRGQWSDLPTRDVFAVAATAPAEDLVTLATRVREATSGTCEVNVQQDANHPEDTWLEVIPPNVSKAAAVKALLPTVGATRLVVFGDNLNDLPMFEIADESYAVANAAPAVRRAATAVIGSNTDDGVARWLVATVHKKV